MTRSARSPGVTTAASSRGAGEESDRFPPGKVLELEVDSVASGGWGIARKERFVFLVSGGFAGDRVRARVVKRFPRHAEARVLEVLRPSPLRVEPECDHADVCGGCTWMAMEIGAQREAKSAVIADAVERVGKLSDVEVRPTVASPRALGYRNRIDFAFGVSEGRLVAGLNQRGKPGSPFAVRQCLLAPPVVSEIARAAAGLLDAQGHGVWGSERRPGILRQIVLRVSRDGNEVLANVVSGPGRWQRAGAFARVLRDAFPSLVGVVRSVNPHRSLMRRGDETLLAGRDHLLERMDGLTFEVGANAFFQVNSEAAEILFDGVVEALDLDADDEILDLYCGSGAISLVMARRVAGVLGVESDPLSVHRAERNAERNGVGNARFLRGDVAGVLADFVARDLRPEKVVVNPPRAGLSEAVAGHLITLGPERLAYVSCNPPTLARDLARLVAGGFAIDALQPVDLFPQTHHVEVLARLRRKG